MFLLDAAKKSMNSARRAVAGVLIKHPWLISTTVMASHLCLVAATQYNLRDKADPSPCSERAVAFEGFGALETTQCDPVIEVYQLVTDAITNATTIMTLGWAYFELSSVKNPFGSDTLAQVPIECLQKKLNKIVSTIIQTAQFDNPPLNPFPSSYRGTCEITVDEWTVVKGSYDSNNHYRTSTTRPRRMIDFIFENLNPTVCNNIIDFINNEAVSCHDQQRVSQLDAGKAFLVIGLIAGAAVVVAGGVCLVVKLNDCRSEESNLSRFFSRSFTPRHIADRTPHDGPRVIESAC